MIAFPKGKAIFLRTPLKYRIWIVERHPSTKRKKAKRSLVNFIRKKMIFLLHDVKASPHYRC